MSSQKVERLITIPIGMVIVSEYNERRIKLEVELGLAAARLLYHSEEEEDGKKEEKIEEENKPKQGSR